MLQIAGGVVLGGFILYLLYVLAEPLSKLAFVLICAAATVTALGLIVELSIGVWDLGHHRRATGISGAVVGFASLMVMMFLWSEFADGFVRTRSLAAKISKRFRPKIQPKPLLDEAPLTSEQLRLRRRSERRTFLREQYADQIQSTGLD